ncbi:unnamed protein product [Coregonus sp. 'balchen']|nr:unnamed protein product [Coregonus sp. 'balchen']
MSPAIRFMSPSERSSRCMAVISGSSSIVVRECAGSMMVSGGKRSARGVRGSRGAWGSGVFQGPVGTCAPGVTKCPGVSSPMMERRIGLRVVKRLGTLIWWSETGGAEDRRVVEVQKAEFGAECYCGHKIQAPNASESECNMECKGDKGNLCGGANRLSIYRLELSQESARRYGSAIFKGCFHRPDNVTLALPISAVIQNMSVEKCVDMCTEKELSLAVLAGDRCLCGFPTPHFSLHEMEDEDMCLHRCHGEEFESCGNDKYFVVYQTQVQDNRCMDRRFLPTRSKQLMALASFPGAGNTWARHLIELATGFYTGSYYFDGSLYNKGTSGKKEIEAFDASIVMIRNPYKALMAEFNRKYGGHIGFASQAHWRGKEWPEFVKNYSPWWASHTLDWLRYGRNVHVVHFEELKRDLFSKLKDMVLFLGLEVAENRLLCVEGQKDGNFKRSGLRKLDYDPYTPEMRTSIDELVMTVDASLKKRNMAGVPKEYRPTPR